MPEPLPLFGEAARPFLHGEGHGTHTAEFMPANLSGWTGLILVVIILLLFVTPRLPSIANLAQSAGIFKREIRAHGDDPDKRPTAATPEETDPKA